jgi:hypothetical protein
VDVVFLRNRALCVWVVQGVEVEWGSRRIMAAVLRRNNVTVEAL